MMTILMPHPVALRDLFIGEGPIRAVVDTGGHLRPIAEIALARDPGAKRVLSYRPGRTHHDAHPAAHAPALVADDGASTLIAMHGSRDAGLQAGRLVTLATLQSKGHRAALLNDQTGHQLGPLATVSLDDVV